MKVFALYITCPVTGYVSVETFPTAFDRALEVIRLASQPVLLRIAEY